MLSSFAITRAGLPATTLLAGMSRVTTAPALTTQPGPIVTPGSTKTRAPSQLPSPITTRAGLERSAAQLGPTDLVTARQDHDLWSKMNPFADAKWCGQAQRARRPDSSFLIDLEQVGQCVPTEQRKRANDLRAATNAQTSRSIERAAAMINILWQQARGDARQGKPQVNFASVRLEGGTQPALRPPLTERPTGWGRPEHCQARRNPCLAHLR